MPVPVLGHVPEFYAVGSAVLAAAERDETGEAG
jgi:hypothetical protein